MKVAITPWNQRVAPVFDSAERILILDVEPNTKGPGQQREDMNVFGREFDCSMKSPAEKAHFLVNQGVEQLICGAISKDLELLIQNQGIDVYSFITGTLDVVLNAWRTGQIDKPIYTMPGCIPGRHHRWGSKGNRAGFGRGLKGGYYAKR